MQPAAAEVERITGLVDYGPRAAAEALTRFNKQAVGAGFMQQARGRNAGCTGTDHHHVYIIARHHKPTRT